MRYLLLSILFPTAALPAELIRCPDWQALLEQERSYVLRTSSPNRSFDEVVAASAPTVEKSETVGAPLSALRPNAVVPQGAACPTYTVKRGDTLAQIAKAQLGDAKAYHTIAQLNGISVSSNSPGSSGMIRAGQVLKIPCKTSVPPGGAVQVQQAAPVASVPSPPLPVWSASPGTFLTDTVKSWAKTAGYKVVQEGADDWKIAVPVSVQGTFEEALSQLVRGFEGTGRPPAISIYSNKVVKIGAP